VECEYKGKEHDELIIINLIKTLLDQQIVTLLPDRKIAHNLELLEIAKPVELRDFLTR